MANCSVLLSLTLSAMVHLFTTCTELREATKPQCWVLPKSIKKKQVSLRRRKQKRQEYMPKISMTFSMDRKDIAGDYSA